MDSHILEIWSSGYGWTSGTRFFVYLFHGQLILEEKSRCNYAWCQVSDIIEHVKKLVAENGKLPSASEVSDFINSHSWDDGDNWNDYNGCKEISLEEYERCNEY